MRVLVWVFSNLVQNSKSLPIATPPVVITDKLIRMDCITAMELITKWGFHCFLFSFKYKNWCQLYTLTTKSYSDIHTFTVYKLHPLLLCRQTTLYFHVFPCICPPSRSKLTAESCNRTNQARTPILLYQHHWSWVRGSIPFTKSNNMLMSSRYNSSSELILHQYRGLQAMVEFLLNLWTYKIKVTNKKSWWFCIWSSLFYANKISCWKLFFATCFLSENHLRAWHSYRGKNYSEPSMIRQWVVFGPHPFLHFSREENCIFNTKPNSLHCIMYITAMDTSIIIRVFCIPYSFLQ